MGSYPATGEKTENGFGFQWLGSQDVLNGYQFEFFIIVAHFLLRYKCVISF